MPHRAKPPAIALLTGTFPAAPDVSRTYLQGNLLGTARFTDRLYGYLGLSGEVRDGHSSELGGDLGVRISL